MTRRCGGANESVDTRQVLPALALLLLGVHVIVKEGRQGRRAGKTAEFGSMPLKGWISDVDLICTRNRRK